jgi:hypothetical protein
LKKYLGLPSPKPAIYMLWMANQSSMKLVKIIRNLKIHIHGILYIATFIIMWNNVLDGSYSMFLSQP